MYKISNNMFPRSLNRSFNPDNLHNQVRFKMRKIHLVCDGTDFGDVKSKTKKKTPSNCPCRIFTSSRTYLKETHAHKIATAYTIMKHV